MSQSTSHQQRKPTSTTASLAAVDSLVSALNSKDGSERQHARLSLVAIGKPAVPALIQALTSHDWHSRWEAAKALGAIHDPSAAPSLIRALDEEERFGVRWLAAEGLLALGSAGIPPLLQALIDRPDSPWLREGAHHILRLLADTGLRQELAPIMAALEDVEPGIRVPIAARAVLDTLQGEGKKAR